MALAAMWKSAKQTYEKKTEEKKPSKTFLSLRTGAGLDAPLALLDKATKVVDAKKAAEDFKKAVKTYEPLVAKRITEEKDKARQVLIRKEGEALVKALHSIEAALPKHIQDVAGLEVKAKIDAFEASLQKKQDFYVMIKDKDWGPVFMAFAKAGKRANEEIAFLVDLDKGVKPLELQKRHFGAKSLPLNISGGADAAAKATPPDFKAARAECLRTVRDPIADFINERVITYAKNTKAKAGV